MLNIKTVRNPLVTDSDKNGYCFRSSCSQTMKLKNLARAMAEYNSSFTEADLTGMLNVLETIVLKYLSQGFNVELPFGTLKPNATGTCANIQDGFTLGNGNHQLNILFSPSDDAYTHLKRNLEYKQIPPDNATDAKIYRVTALNDDASETNDLNLVSGRFFRIHGRNLTFDLLDEKQGLFLENESGVSRLTTFSRRGTNVIDAVIPAGIASGSYSVSVITKPGNLYTTATINTMITIA